MTPQLSIVKTRFAKASLRARCARHRSWRPPCRLPNGCIGHSASPIEEQGHSATQRLLWSSSFPIHETDRRARLAVWQNTHPLQAASQLQMLYLSTSNNVAIFRVPIKVATPGGFYTIDGRLPTGTEQWGRLYRSCSRPFLLDQAAILLKVANSPKHDGFVPDHSTASLIMGLHTIVGVSCCRSIVCRRLWSLRSN